METMLNQQPATVGWFSVLIFVVWQLYAPKLGIDTRTSEIVGSVNERIDDVGERIDELEDKQDSIIEVTEVIAVHQDDIDGSAVATILGNDTLDEQRILDHNRNRGSD
jgi:hypothetical protein